MGSERGRGLMDLAADTPELLPLKSSPAFVGEGDHAKHGGGVASAEAEAERDMAKNEREVRRERRQKFICLQPSSRPENLCNFPGDSHVDMAQMARHR